MALKSDSRIRTRTRNFSACYRHRTQPSAGICAACLRERLSGVNADPELSSLPIIPALLPPAGDARCNDGVSRPWNKAAGDSSSCSFPPDLRRCRSVSALEFEASCSSSEPRRRSCEVRDRNTLALLFNINDDKAGPGADIQVETKNIGLSRLGRFAGELIKDAEIDGETRVSIDTLQPNANAAMEGELMTMKEYINIEIQSRNQKSKDLKDIAGNLWEAASVFSKKLLKWRQKQNSKNILRVDCNANDAFPTRKGKQKTDNLRETQSDVGENAMGRRSCDTEPRYSVDAGRLSVENPHVMVDDPRASWDGYLVARNIPRIAPRLSVDVGGENVVVDGQMHSIVEDDSSAGCSGQSNSDSSFSQRESSSDRSSSILECHEQPNSASLKLVITEKELKDWHLKSVKDGSFKTFESFPKEAPAVGSCKRLNGSTKKATTWRKVCNVFGFKQKLDVSEKPNMEITKPVMEAKELKNPRLTRSSSSVVRARNSTDNKIEMIPSRSSVSEGLGYGNTGRFLLTDRNRNGKCTSSNLDNGVLPFYLMPLRSSRCKNSRSMLLNSDCISQNVLN